MSQPSDELAGLEPFGIFDFEAERLARFFAGLDGGAWDRPSRCAGWSVKDVLGHLAGAEMYNHACLDDDVAGFFSVMQEEAGAGGPQDYGSFNEWCVRERRGTPAAVVLDEWLSASGETRWRMRDLLCRLPRRCDGDLGRAVSRPVAGVPLLLGVRHPR